MDKKGEINVLRDEVKDQKKGRMKTPIGVDEQNRADSAAFVWRGKGA